MTVGSRPLAVATEVGAHPVKQQVQADLVAVVAAMLIHTQVATERRDRAMPAVQVYGKVLDKPVAVVGVDFLVPAHKVTEIKVDPVVMVFRWHFSVKIQHLLTYT
jgi:hypothetical protein